MPHSLRAKVKKLCYQGHLKEKERDRILKALDIAENLPEGTANTNTLWFNLFREQLKNEPWYTEEMEDIINKAIMESEDTISRQDALDAFGHGTTYTSEDIQRIIKGL